MPELDVRPEVAAFALAMEKRLRENDWKHGWKNEHRATLFDGLRKEVEELRVAANISCPACRRCTNEYALDMIKHEAADVANFAMFIADSCGVLG